MKIARIFNLTSVVACAAFAAVTTANAAAPVGCQSKGALYVLKSGVQTPVVVTPGANTTAAASNQGHAGFKTSATGEFNLTIPSRVMVAGEQYYFRMEVHNSQYLAYGISGLYGNTFATLPTAVSGQIMCDGTSASQRAGVKLGVVPPPNRFVNVGSAPVTECFKDTLTGRVWEGKAPSGTNVTVTNYDSLTKLQYLNVNPTIYRAPTPAELAAPNNSLKYMATVNGASLCGATNWRLPTAPELSALYTAVGGAGSALFNQWLPNTAAGFYVSSTNGANDHLAVNVNFANGNSVPTGAGRNNLYKIRLVHD